MLWFFTIGGSSLSLYLLLVCLWGVHYTLSLHSLSFSFFFLFSFFSLFLFTLYCLFSFNAWVNSFFLDFNIRHGGTYDSTALSRTRWVFHWFRINLLYPPSDSHAVDIPGNVWISPLACFTRPHALPARLEDALCAYHGAIVHIPVPCKYFARLL